MRAMNDGMFYLYSNCASQGVFVSVMEPVKISFPMIIAAALEGPDGWDELAAWTVQALALSFAKCVTCIQQTARSAGLATYPGLEEKVRRDLTEERYRHGLREAKRQASMFLETRFGFAWWNGVMPASMLGGMPSCT